MNDTQQMLQAILNGQGAVKQELLSTINKVDQKVDKLGERLEGKIEGLDGKIDGVEKRLTGRLDKIGRQLAYLEDDTPTREEFENSTIGRISSFAYDLEERVDNMSGAPASH